MDWAAKVASWDIGGDPPPEALPDAQWHSLLTQVRRHRLAGLLVAAVSSGAWPVTGPQREESASLHRQSMATALSLEQDLLGVADALGARQVRWRLLKGPAVAHLDYDDPALRCFGDLDLLVASYDLDHVYDHLAEMGGRRHYPSRGRTFDNRFGKGAAFTLTTGTEVDIHRTLALGPFGLALDPEAIFEDPERFHLAGRELAGPPRHWRFLHSCYHVALSGSHRRYSALRDLVQQLPRDELEARRALAAAHDHDATVVVARALALTADTLDWRPVGSAAALVDWGRSLAPTVRDARWLDVYEGGANGSRRRTLTAMEALVGWRARFTYAVTVVNPLAGRTPARARRGAAAARCSAP